MIGSVYILSAIVIIIGISSTLLFTSFWFSMIGFCLVGFGTASIYPITFTLAGTSKKYAPGTAISIIATYATVGMFIEPPLIGYIAHTFNLKVSFAIFFFSGLMFIPISQLFFKHQKTL